MCALVPIRAAGLGSYYTAATEREVQVLHAQEQTIRMPSRMFQVERNLGTRYILSRVSQASQGSDIRYEHVTGIIIILDLYADAWSL